MPAPDTVSTATDERDATVKTFDRAAGVLKVLAASGPEGLPLRNVAALSGLGKPTTHRLLGALIHAGFAFQDTGTRHYRLGAGLSALARTAMRQDIGALAHPYVERVAELTSDTAYASVREGNAAVCIAREIGSFPIRTLSLQVGDRRPLGVGSGSLAILAFMDDDEIDLIIKQNENWTARFGGLTSAYLRSAIAEARKQGFSFVEGQIIPGMNAIGVPVRDETGKVVASLSATAITARVKGERIGELASVLTEQAADLSRALALRSPRS